MNEENDCVGYNGVVNFHVYPLEWDHEWDDEIIPEGMFVMVGIDPAYECLPKYYNLETTDKKTALKRAKEIILKEGGTII